MAFTLQLGVCKDPKNKINKTMSDATTYNCKVKKHIQTSPMGGAAMMEGINIITPQLVLQGGDEILSKNYAYIPNFNRYYFVHDIELSPNGMYTVSLVEDVLMSFKEDILNCEVMLARSADFCNYYLKDDRLPVTQQTLTWNKPFSATPFKEKSFDAIVTFLGPSSPTNPQIPAAEIKEV